MGLFRLTSVWLRISNSSSQIILALAIVFQSVSATFAGPIVWSGDYATARRVAAQSKKPLLVMVTAKWCAYCEQMKRQTLSDAAIAKRVTAHFVPVMIDADEQPELAQRLDAISLPTLLIFSPVANEMGRMTGFQSVAQLDVQLAAYSPELSGHQIDPARSSFLRAHSSAASNGQVAPYLSKPPTRQFQLPRSSFLRAHSLARADVQNAENRPATTTPQFQSTPSSFLRAHSIPLSARRLNADHPAPPTRQFHPTRFNYLLTYARPPAAPPLR